MLKIRKKLKILSMDAVVEEQSKVFYDMLRDGLTQNLISTWLSCRQKARLYLEGWDSQYHSPALIDGGVGHAALELAYLDIKAGKLRSAPDKIRTKKYINEIDKRWKAENSRPNKETLQFLENSLALAEVILPKYFDYWKKDFKNIQWEGLEEKFKVNCPIVPKPPALLNIPIQGKRDGKFKLRGGLWLFETKFKAMINESSIVDSLAIDFQVMLYLWSMWQQSSMKEVPKGVLYNIIRRTSLKQYVDESLPSYAKRIAIDIDKRPDFYFMRMESAITQQDLVVFEWDLMGIVKEMYLWWEGIVPHYKNTYSCIGKYGRCSNLGVCTAADYSGLIKRKSVFKELEDF